MNKIFNLRNKSILVILIILTFFSFKLGYNYFIVKENEPFKPDPNIMLVHYIDVGQGDSILIQVNNKNLLIDSGPNSDEKKLFNYLSSLYIDKFDYVIATHPHEDHIGNMAKIIKEYNVLEFYAPKIQSTTKTFEKMLDTLKSKHLKINVIKKGTNSIDLGHNTKVTVFSPIKDFYEDLNNYSPVIKIEYGNTSFLFTGDAQKEVEKEILDNNENISANVLKIGHHGSSTSTSTNFLKKVNPMISVISVGKDNIYNHPYEGTINLLNMNKITIYRTDIDGNILLYSDGYKIAKKH
ncbi:ComEC/Rec2 family competence protein [Clostridium saccharoperbutylacetonicum]